MNRDPWRSDADLAFQDIRKLLSPEAIQAIREAHATLGLYDCIAHYEGSWCCIEALIGDEPEHTGDAIWSEHRKA